MTIEFFILIVLVIAGFGGLFWLVGRKKEPEANPQEQTSHFLMMQNQIQELTRTLDARMGESARTVNESVRTQFSESQRVIRDVNEQMVKHLTDVTRGVAEANEASKQIFTVAGALKNLEKVLTHQKQRGNLGEAGLELILSNILPPTAYKLQYQFLDGDTVDAVILTKDGMIPVDAKFSLDNYNRIINETDEGRKEELERDFKNDLTRRINETAKYIKPKEGTLPFAFMFIPAEGIYYDLLVNEIGTVKVNTRSLIDYAHNEKKVIIVSPTTFSAFLQSVLYGFRAFKIEEQAKHIAKNVEALSRHIKAYDDYFKKLGGHLQTTVNTYNIAGKELAKIDKDVLHITGERIGIEPMALARPESEE